MTATAQRIVDAPAADRSLHERIALDRRPDEIKELADTFDPAAPCWRSTPGTSG
ncbi:hypothetical protein [Streptomyces scabrisporus]|uniref:hypothetical protein n=1 Tax=Embleya scabrispora TaxID=159449 RepID=UPI0003709CB5